MIVDNFQVIYKILSTLEKAMDYPDFDCSRISFEKIGITEERWKRIMEMLVDEGYVKNVLIEETFDGIDVDASEVKITLRGLEYLHENSTMQKIYRTLKGIKDVTPFV